ncbi:MAG: RNA pseudouridine synthase [Halobacteriovoraceae bacterium]|nr:RNA pseudouridine synthase [Halobacteriovoraceae bacterium]|tara:strand:+ start:18727 stop:19695 length:969 start_codon:yes stop_codon:yes gene_type:complete
MTQEPLVFIIHSDDLEKHKRLDTYLGEKIPHLSRSLIKKLFENGEFESKQKLSLKKMPSVGTRIIFHDSGPKDTEILAEDIPLDILFEDEYLLIINKPAGMVVHPAPGNYTGTLVNAVLHHCPDLKGIGDEKRPGIVHRLDKGTTGIMMVAKEQQTHAALVKLLSKHDIIRKYEALIVGARIPSETFLDAPIGRSPHNRLKMATDVKNAKVAKTHFKALEFFERLTHCELKLETGRTHQIRVHLSSLLNAPILNDHLYGRTKEEQLLLSNQIKGLIKDYEYPFLHAKVLGFIHPITKKELFFEKEPPELFQKVLEQLRLESE